MAEAADAVDTVRASANHAARRIVFQGQPGAYSHLACRQVCPHLEAVPADPSRRRSRRCARARPSGR